MPASTPSFLSDLDYRAYAGEPGMRPLDQPREGDVLWLPPRSRA